MSKKVYTIVEVFKIILLSLFLTGIYPVVSTKFLAKPELAVIGYSFLFLFGALILSTILLDIFFSFFIPREKNSFGEWEKIINNNVMRNFSYVLAAFFILMMTTFALDIPRETILLFLQLGFICLLITVNLTKAYYYEG